MHHRIRRAISLLFVLIFLVAAPALIISTAGYRYNFLKGRIERTGVLFVSSKPSNAHIILNGSDTEKTTPSRIRRLLPGTYDVRLERDGFHSWSRTIEIFSRQTSFLNNVTLFRDTQPASILNIPIDHAEFSPDRRYVAVETTTPSHTELRVVDLRDGKTTLPYRTENVTAVSVQVTWSPDSTRFFVTRKSVGRPTFYLWSEDAPDEMTSLLEISPRIYEEAFWSQEGRFLHAVAGGTLYAINVRDKTSMENGPAASSMRIIDSTVFGVFRDASGTTLVKRGLQENAFQVLGAIPEGHYTHLSEKTLLISLYDVSNTRLLIIDPSSLANGLTYHELRAEDADWSEDNVLLYRNGFELHVFDPSSGIDRLVTRLGGNLGVAQWYPENGLVLYSNGEDALMTQASDEYERDVITLAHFTELTDIAIDKKGTYAWFIGNLDDRNGLWQLRLR